MDTNPCLSNKFGKILACSIFPSSMTSHSNIYVLILFYIYNIKIKKFCQIKKQTYKQTNKTKQNKYLVIQHVQPNLIL